MDIFYFLRKVREFERRRLPFIKSLEDRDIVLVIGQAQVRGNPLALKQLLLSGIAPTATLHRRLTRLVDAGVVDKTFRNGDRRMIELTLSLPVLKTFKGYARVLATAANRSVTRKRS